MAICYLSLSHFAAMKANSLQTVAMCNAFAARETTYLFFFDDDGSHEAALRANFRLHADLRLAPVRRKAYAFKPRMRNLLRMARLACGVAEPIRFLFTREVFLAFFLTFLRRPFYLEHHLNLRQGWHGLLMRWIGRSRNFIAHVPISSSMIGPLGLSRRRGERILVLHDGVDLALFDGAGSREEARRTLGLPQGRFLAGYCGQLYKDKGAWFILDLAEAMPEAGFLLVGGEAKDLEAITSEMRARGLANVHFAGRVEHAKVPGYLAACDCLLLPNPTNYYMSPLKLFEYMASRRPVIASDFPPFREVIEPGASGILVPPGDKTAFLDALRRLRDEPGLGDRLAAVARSKAEREYSWEGRVERLFAEARTREN